MHEDWIDDINRDLEEHIHKAARFSAKAQKHQRKIEKLQCKRQDLINDANKAEMISGAHMERQTRNGYMISIESKDEVLFDLNCDLSFTRFITHSACLGKVKEILSDCPFEDQDKITITYLDEDALQ